MQQEEKIGVFSATSRGFGFVRPMEEGASEVFIPAKAVKDALHGDTVVFAMVREAQGNMRAEGKILRVEKRAYTTVVGTFEKENRHGFVIPDDSKLDLMFYVADGDTAKAKNGDKVIARITSYGQPGGRGPQAKVESIFGNISDPRTDLPMILSTIGIVDEFPEDTLAEADACPKTVTEADLLGRTDLREQLTVTIDGEDARDLDDAISLTKTDRGYELDVHIADVSHYVKENTALDREALERATSVYLCDHVVPMLPKALSNGICSLNEGVDRLCLSCRMVLDKNGKMVSHAIEKTVIRSDRRLSYNRVMRLFEGTDAEDEALPAAVVSMLLEMRECAAVLRERRRERGSIDFESRESEIPLGPDKAPLDVRPHEANDATRLIEDFMLLANETVAEEFYWRGLPFFYRNHAPMDREKSRTLVEFISFFGYHVQGSGEIHPKELQKLLAASDGSPEGPLIHRVALRSMQRAVYGTSCDGHYGLAARYYTHFTSPIRRYPDLQIHRIIGETLAGTMDEARTEALNEVLGDRAVHCSVRERRADEAERKLDKVKKCRYMEAHIGESFEAVISGVHARGFYAELPNTVEVSVPVEVMDDDYYEYDSTGYLLVGCGTGKKYRLGQPVTVKIVGVDIATTQIVAVPCREKKKKKK